jgi:hypothetical protein
MGDSALWRRLDLSFPDMALRKLPIGIQDFPSLREDGYLYVDKTEFVSG